MVEKTTTIDQITVCEKGVILIREVTKISEDGKELSQSYHRTTLEPGADLTGQEAKVVTVCTAVWTPKVIAEYQASIAVPG